MPFKVNLGISKKIGQPNYGSLGASCNVDFELDGNLLRDDLDGFLQQLNNGYAACRQAVQDELARQQNSAANEESQAGAVASVSRQSNGNGHGVSEKQLSYLDQLARQIEGLGVHKLDTIANGMFDSPVTQLSSLQASSLIDTLKAIKEGRLSLDAAISGGATSSAIAVCPVGPQQRSGSVWDYVSASRLNLWLRCPLAFKLRYIDGIKTPTTANLFLGKRVHDALEFYYRHRQFDIQLDANDVLRRISDTWDEASNQEKLKFEKSAGETSLQQQAKKLVQAYFEQLGHKEPKPLAVETSLESPLVDPTTGEDLGIPLVGIVDLICDNQAGPVICDFKTSSRSSAPLAITHEIQLSCYAYLFRRMSGQEEGGLEIRSLVKTQLPKIQRHNYEPRRDGHFRRLFAAIGAYLADLRSRRFIYRPGLSCSMCDFRESHCQLWDGGC